MNPIVEAATKINAAVDMYRALMADRHQSQNIWTRWQVMHACNLSAAQNDAFKAIVAP